MNAQAFIDLCAIWLHDDLQVCTTSQERQDLWLDYLFGGYVEIEVDFYLN